MAANPSMGTCEFCGKTDRKAAMARHVVTCAAEREGGAPTEPLVHVRIEAAGAPEYSDASPPTSDTSSRPGTVWSKRSRRTWAVSTSMNTMVVLAA